MCLNNDINNFKVAPLVGAWIEIFINLSHSSLTFVAPLVGAWIEILLQLNLY